MLDLFMTLTSKFQTAIAAETITCLRSVLMKPEHADWLEQIWELLEGARAKACHRQIELPGKGRGDALD